MTLELPVCKSVTWHTSYWLRAMADSRRKVREEVQGDSADCEPEVTVKFATVPARVAITVISDLSAKRFLRHLKLSTLHKVTNWEPLRWNMANWPGRACGYSSVKIIG
eukprot:g62172.t1